jgi:hypothetical protein
MLNIPAPFDIGSRARPRGEAELAERILDRAHVVKHRGMGGGAKRGSGSQRE